MDTYDWETTTVVLCVESDSQRGRDANGVVLTPATATISAIGLEWYRLLLFRVHSLQGTSTCL